MAKRLTEQERHENQASAFYSVEISRMRRARAEMARLSKQSAALVSRFEKLNNLVTVHDGIQPQMEALEVSIKTTDREIRELISLTKPRETRTAGS